MHVRPGFRIATVLFVCGCAGAESAALEESTTGEREQEPADRRREALAPLLAERRQARQAYEAGRVRPGVDEGELAKSLEASVLGMQRYFNAALEQAGLLEKDSRERAERVNALLSDLKSERGYYDDLEYPGVVIWLEYSIGRAYVLAGDVDKACKEGFDPVCDFDNTRLPVKAVQWTDSLKLFAFYTRAESLFGAKRYEKAIEAVDAMFAPPLGYAWALDDPKGNAAALIKARALYLKRPRDFHGAIRECERVIDRNLVPWPNNARMLIRMIYLVMLKSPGAKPHLSPGKIYLSPARIHQKAIGSYHLAQQERDPGRRMKLLEKAVKGLRDTIAACRQEDVPYVTRLEHESSAWFELGICYSKMELWYEAGFAFEALLKFFSKEKVGRVLAKRRRFREMWEDIRAKVNVDRFEAEGEGEVANPYIMLFDRTKSGPVLGRLLKGLETRLMKSASNRVTAARRRHRETRSKYDSQRLNEAISILPDFDWRVDRRPDFHIGLLRRQDAEGLLKAGKPEEAVSRWKGAARIFLKSAEAHPSLTEFAYHLAGDASYRAMVEVMKLAQEDPKRSAEARALARQALAAYGKFTEKANAAPEGSRAETAKRRKRLEATARAKEHIEQAYGPAP